MKGTVGIRTVAEKNLVMSGNDLFSTPRNFISRRIAPLVMVTGMADYRLYLLDPEGHVARSIELQRETDAEALREVSSLAYTYGMELWQLDRRVCTFKPSPPECA